MKVKGSKELKASVLDSGMCTGCGACVSLCPYFATHRGKTVMHFSCSRDEGRCHAYCPRAEVDLDGLSSQVFGAGYSADPLGNHISIRAVRAGEKAGLKNFQTAGTVSALMKFALEKGYLDSAVLTANDKGYGIPVIATDPADVEKASGSRYSASPTVKGVNEAVNSGYSKIGAVGTPCQVMAITQMRGNPTGKEGFSDPVALTVGLFCTWALNGLEFTTLLKTKTDLSSIRKFDIPPPPASVMNVETSGGSFDISLEEIRKIIPDACSFCHDMTAEFADISVGVFEGKTKQNIVIIRTERGRKLFDEAVSAGYLVTDEIPGVLISPLASASMNKKRKGLAKLSEKGLLNSENGDATIRMNQTTLSTIMKGGA